MTLKGYIWSIDPIGSLLFTASATLMLLALDWAAGAYPWHDTHVAVPLSIGLAFLVFFCVYGEFSIYLGPFGLLLTRYRN